MTDLSGRLRTSSFQALTSARSGKSGDMYRALVRKRRPERECSRCELLTSSKLMSGELEQYPSLQRKLSCGRTCSAPAGCESTVIMLMPQVWLGCTLVLCMRTASESHRTAGSTRRSFK